MLRCLALLCFASFQLETWTNAGDRSYRLSDTYNIVMCLFNKNALFSTFVNYISVCSVMKQEDKYNLSDESFSVSAVTINLV